MIYQSPAYWALLAVAAAVFALCADSRVRLRCAALIAGSLGALVLVVGIDPRYGALLLVSIGWVVVSARAAAGSSVRQRWALHLFGPVAIVWIASKISTAAHAGPFLFVGFSYFFIKAGTLLKDVQDGRINDPDAFVVAAYFLHFPTFVSGPMHLFGEFDRAVRLPRFPDLEGAIDVTFRVLLGFVKLVVVSPLFLPMSLAGLGPGPLSMSALAVGSLAYSVVIWANFSGYSDLAIATSRLIGVPVPENFNYPYAARNIREFWQRWHITFTRVLTNYLFIPLSRQLPRFMADRPRLLMIVATLVTFLFCGFWHGATPNFVAWGLYHALGLIVFDLYRPGATRRRLARRGRPHAPLINGIGWAAGVTATFAFVSAGWILFVFPLSRLLGD